MAKVITVPKLGLTMEKATIVTWMKEEGDRVDKGESLCIIETDKVNFEVEAPEPGKLMKITANEGDILPVGAVMGVIAGDGEIFDVDRLIQQAAEVEPIPEGPPPEIPTVMPVSRARAERSRMKVSPLARRIAEEKGVNLDEIIAPGGTISKEDVLSTKNSNIPKPFQRMSGMIIRIPITSNRPLMKG